MYRINDFKENNFTSLKPDVDHLKHQLINYIYDTVNLSNFRYDILTYTKDLNTLFSQKYFVSANFTGSNGLLVFTKVNDKYHSFVVDRKTLTYNINKLDINSVKTTNVHVKLDIDIYQGTIFDGIFITSKNKKTFIITDVYVFKGNNLTESQIDSKLLTVMSYLKMNYSEGDRDNDIILAINRLYDITDTKHVVNNVIPDIKGFIIRGICYYPVKSGTKLIYLFNNSENNVSDANNQTHSINRYKIVPKTNSTSESSDSSTSECDRESPKIITNVEKQKAPKMIYTPKGKKTDESYVFEIKKTDVVDVYILNAIECVEKTIKRKKIGLAFIPNAARSNWCIEIMNDKNQLLVHCKFHKDKMKWEPILVSTSKRPSEIGEFNAMEKSFS